LLYFLNALVIVAIIAYLLILIAGLYFCKKTRFTEGVYFFLIMIIFQVCSYFVPFYTGKLLDYYQQNNAQIPGGMSIGELIASYSIIGYTLKVIPFLILVIGLYRLWKTNIKNSS
jgi:hypothetical protein